MKWPRRAKRGAPARGPSQSAYYFYGPRAAKSQPRYRMSALTDSKVVRLVAVNGLTYPVFDGFFNALLRFIYRAENCTEPFNENLAEHPFRIYDQGESIYTYKLLIPWPADTDKVEPCWHPWYRAPPTKTRVVTKTTDKEGKVTELEEDKITKGKLSLFVLHPGHVTAPGLGFHSAETIIDHSHQYEALGEEAITAEIATRRALHAEAVTHVEASRSALENYTDKFSEEAKRGSMSADILSDVRKITRKGEKTGHDKIPKL